MAVSGFNITVTGRLRLKQKNFKMCVKILLKYKIEVFSPWFIKLFNCAHFLGNTIFNEKIPWKQTFQNSPRSGTTSAGPSFRRGGISQSPWAGTVDPLWECTQGFHSPYQLVWYHRSLVLGYMARSWCKGVQVCLLFRIVRFNWIDINEELRLALCITQKNVTWLHLGENHDPLALGASILLIYTLVEYSQKS